MRRPGRIETPASARIDFVDDSRNLKPRVDEFDLFHLRGHSYSQLIHDLPPGIRSVLAPRGAVVYSNG
jgi:hypothetical protein